MKQRLPIFVVLSALLALSATAASFAAPRAQAELRPVQYMPIVRGRPAQLDVTLTEQYSAPFSSPCLVPPGKVETFQARYTSRTATSARIQVLLDGVEWTYREVQSGTALIIQACTGLVHWADLEVGPAGVILHVQNPLKPVPQPLLAGESAEPEASTKKN